MKTFSDEDKQESSGKWFNFGVHKVQFGLIENGGLGDGEKEYIEITVMDPNDGEITDTARVWFSTDAASKYSFNTLKQIYVHCAPDDKKDQARTDFDGVANTNEIVELMQKCIGKELWFTKYPDPTRTYLAKDGSTKKSINKNVLGYKPKLNEALMPKDSEKDELNKTFEGAKPADGEAAANIPDDWS